VTDNNKEKEKEREKEEGDVGDWHG